MTPAKLEANRTNALASTGPRTAEGKAISRTNATTHGLLALVPVALPHLERTEDWEDHRDGILSALAPAGPLEIALAERAALLLWRLARVARYEREAAADVLNDAEKEVSEDREIPCDPQDVHEVWSGVPARVQEIRACLADAREDRERLMAHQKHVEQGETLDGDDATDFLYLLLFNHFWSMLSGPRKEAGRGRMRESEVGLLTCKALGALTVPCLPAREEWEDFTGWTPELLRQAWMAAADVAGRTPEDLLKDALSVAKFRERDFREGLKRAEAAVDRFRRKHLLPDGRTMEMIARYEAHFERSVFRTLHELERLQAHRAGVPVPAPAVLDVQVDMVRVHKLRG